MPFFLGWDVAGMAFRVEVGVGFVPSGFMVFLTGVAFVAEVVLDLIGVEDAEAVVVPLVRATGRAFCVPRGVRVAAGLEAALTVALGVVVGVALFAAAGVALLAVTGVFFTVEALGIAGVALETGRVFWVPRGVRTNFAGAFLTGVAPVFVAEGFEDAGVTFLTGVVFEAAVVFVGVVVGFFATFSMLLTLAGGEC